MKKKSKTVQNAVILSKYYNTGIKYLHAYVLCISVLGFFIQALSEQYDKNDN